MKILVAWDTPDQSELLELYLSLADCTVVICSTAEEVHTRVIEESWDVVFMAMTFPSESDDRGFEIYRDLRTTLPDVPVVLGCRATEMIHLPRYLKLGLRYYVTRDERGDFIFLVMAQLESTILGIKAERAAMFADKMREEMDGVRKLQEMIIPKGISQQAGYRTVARYEPSELTAAGGRAMVMAGGDYYEVFPVEDHTLVALVGDASGHGLKACMSIITMHTLIRMISSEAYRKTDIFVADINQRLCENVIVQSGGGFITLFYAAVDVRTHQMRWTSAGHPLALIHNLITDEVYPVGDNSNGGLPLGIYGEVAYDTATSDIPINSRILLFTDGLTDALAPGTDESYGMFGTTGIGRILQECRSLSLEETLDRLFSASREYTCGDGRHDDTSVVLIERFA